MLLLLYLFVKVGLEVQGTGKGCLKMLAYKEDGLPEQFLRGLSVARLSGRSQIVVDPLINASEGEKMISGDLTFYLDEAHSPESMDACARWFSVAAVERNDLSLSLVSSEVETMERAWTNGYIKHCHNKESDEMLKRVLLFNCMDSRDPQILLPKLVDTCASSDFEGTKGYSLNEGCTNN